MATFEYKALTADGKTRKGSLEGDSPRHIRQLLRDQKLTPLDVKSMEHKRKTAGAGGGLFSPVIRTADLALLTSQLHTLLKAGMPLTQAIKAVAGQAETRTVRRFLSNLHAKVTEGHSFAQALTLSHYRVSEEFIATVRAGEESGHLETVLARLAESIRQQEKIRKKIQTAMIYPIIMVMMSVLIVLFLMIYVVPKVVTVFDNMEQSLPPLTQGMLSISEFLQAHWVGLFLGAAALFVGYRLLMKRPDWRRRRDRFWLRLPMLRKFLVYAASARWARTLGVLLASGVPATDALRISSEVMTLLPLKEKVLAMVEQVREGKKLQDAMAEADFFPPLLLNLVQTGEGSGQLDTMLLEGADHYESEVENAAATLVSLIEPLMILIMGGVVLTIVLAIMLPIFEMNQMVG
ncbi:MAG: type II secretion system inner membrane protein GspF [Hydrogenovibrio sp.]